MRLVVCAVFVIACGGTPEPTKRSGTGVSPIAQQQGADDVIVAQVNGRPVWGSCVTAQSKGKAPQAALREALDECVAFELLAQAADARGLTTDPDVIEATRNALVNRVVEVGFEDKYKSADDLKEILDKHIERNKGRLSRPEVRSSTYVRLPLTKPLADAEDPPPKLVELAKKLAGERGMMTTHLRAAVDGVFGAQSPPPEVTEVGLFPKDALVPGYADRLFAIPEVGRIHPEVFRTRFGWDVILLTGVSPAKTYTREEAAAEAFPEVRTAYFNVWVDQIARALGVKIKIDPAQVAKLDEVGP
ncbi:MAG: hypothetical protein M4D80_03880 [Myxococcota bacterium]|nr:hypothetical protein [Deltaproteobacteria bacterium]MDQ3334276.1 hypothetical protein [Myxococcota bacterium]